MMARKILLIVVALVLSVGTAFLAKNWLESNRQAPQPTQVVVEEPQYEKEILIAKADIPVGRFVREQDFAWQPWPSDAILAHHLVKDEFSLDKLKGRVAKVAIPASEPVLLSKLVAPGERGFLSVVLRPGYRAFSFRINESTAVGGLALPGDRVDIIMTTEIQREGKGEDPNVSATILTNVRILAMGAALNPPEGKASTGAKTATVEVTPSQAEIIAVADSVGTLSLSLRPIAKNEEELKILLETGNIEDEADPLKGDSHTWEFEASTIFPKRTTSGGGDSGLIVSRGSESTKVGGD